MTSRGLRFSKVRHRPAVVGTCLCFIIITVEAKPGSAQEIVGKRQFSDQLVVSEPFVEDELEFPSILHILCVHAVVTHPAHRKHKLAPNSKSG